ncbi:MAG: serine hydrolase [Leptolyngbya sp. SIO4C1]|nr:serine hydrolase [Leptolyngbya sp. SIO4C1]
MTDPQMPYRKPARSPSRRTAGPRRDSTRSTRARRARRLPEKASRPGETQRSGRTSDSRARRRSRAQPTPVWPPPSGRMPPLPRAPRPVLYGIRLLVLGIGVAAIAGTLLSVLTPADTKLGELSTSQTASRTESVIMAKSRSLAQSDLSLTQAMTPLKAQISELLELTPGLTPLVYFLDLDTGKYVDLAGQQAAPAASTIKLPILVAFFQEVDAGRIPIEQTLVMQADQVAGGSGDMQGQPPGTQYTALEVATQMIVNSDNTATNMMIDLLGGPEALNQKFTSWGLSSTLIRSPLPDLEGTNTTSAQDLVKVISWLHRGELLSLRSRDRALTILQRTYNKGLIPSGIETEAVIYNKTGDIAAVLADVALVDLPNGKRYALATLVQRPDNDGRAGELIRRISQTVAQEMNKAVTPVLPPSGAVEEAPPGESLPLEEATLEEIAPETPETAAEF